MKIMKFIIVGADRHSNSDRDKKGFVSKNEDNLRSSLESKKQ
jgi:hypothetical protein